jgi:hypothetical protein
MENRFARFAFLLAGAAFVLSAESVAGLRWSSPAGWAEQSARPMRAATYSVPGGTPADAAECAIYFFGAGKGGTVEANIERWRGQYLDNDGKPHNAQVSKRQVHGVAVTLIDTSGTYTGMGGPMAKEPSSNPGYRLLGAIVEGPGGNVFIKFTGPEKTIAANQPKFDQLINSFDKESK